MSTVGSTSRHSPVPAYQLPTNPLKQRQTASTPAPSVTPASLSKSVAVDMDLSQAILISAEPSSCMTRCWNYGVMAFLSLAFRPGYSRQFMRETLDWVMVKKTETLLKAYPNAQFTRSSPGNVDAEEVSAERNLPNTILYLHGGAYFMGSVEGYREHALRLSKACRANVVLLNYALAYPAGLNNAASAYHALARQRPNTPLFIGGDSAGGGLALALACKIRDGAVVAGPVAARLDPEIRAPAGVFCMSPWADLTGTGTAITENAKVDQWLTKRHMDTWASWYAGEVSKRHAAISPAFADYTGVAPLRLFAARNEILLSDSITVATAARRAGVDVQLYVGHNMQHNWSLLFPTLQESDDLLQVIAEFVSKPR